MLPPLVLALVLAQAAAQPARPAVAPDGAPSGNTSGIDWLAVPVVTYDADDGLGLGLAGSLHVLDGTEPYRHQVTAALSVTHKATQSYWIRYDAPRFLDSPLRLWARAEYWDELNAQWYGLGNLAPGRRDPERYNSLHKVRELVRAGVSVPVGPNLYAFGFAALQYVQTRAYPGSLFALQPPPGAQGGGGPALTAGAYWEGRDSETHPERGVYLEGSIRGQPTGDPARFVGLNANARFYLPLARRRVTLALRGMVDWLSADAPFYELSSFGSLEPIEGLGGQSSARGIPRNRFVGRLKVIGTAELRTRLVEVPFPGGPVNLGVVAFLDAGRVWQLEGNDGPPWRVHPGYGFGLRASRRAAVIRVDLGYSPGQGLSPYALFGHFF